MTRYAFEMQATGKAFEIEDCKAGDCSDGSDNSGCPTLEWCPFTSFRVSRDIDASDTRWFLNLQSAIRFLGRGTAMPTDGADVSDEATLSQRG